MKETIRKKKKRELEGTTFRTYWMWDEKEQESRKNLGVRGLAN